MLLRGDTLLVLGSGPRGRADDAGRRLRSRRRCWSAARRTSTARSSTRAASAAACASSSRPTPTRSSSAPELRDTARGWLPRLHADVPPQRPPGRRARRCAASASAGPRRSPARACSPSTRSTWARACRPSTPTPSSRAARSVYGSASSLYVATQRYDEGTYEPGTMLHRFDVSEPERTTYAASGFVAGTLLNQFSLSEDKGILRAASTRGFGDGQREPRHDARSRTAATSSRAARSTASARASGSTPCASWATPATSSPSARPTRSTRSTSATRPTPRVRGELKIPGYSAYLHPVGDGLLLGHRPGRRRVDRARAGAADLALRRLRPRAARAAPAAPARRALLELRRGVEPPRVPVVAGDEARDAARRLRGLRRRGGLHGGPRGRDRGARPHQPPRGLGLERRRSTARRS